MRVGYRLARKHFCCVDFYMSRIFLYILLLHDKMRVYLGNIFERQAIISDPVIISLFVEHIELFTDTTISLCQVRSHHTNCHEDNIL